MTPEPFTYYRTADHSRGWLVAGIEDEGKPGATVVLIEFGKPRTNPTRRALQEFLGLVKDGKMQLFTPNAK